MICKNCNQVISDNNSFCPHCGAAVSAQNPSGSSDFFSGFTSTEDTTASFDPQDIQSNKGMAVLSYLGLLLLIPMFAAKNSPFARFHVNQGLVLFLAEIVCSVAVGIVVSILSAIFTVTGIGFLVIPFQLLSYAVDIACLVFTIMGIVYVCQGKAKKLPLIGNITILK